MNTRAVLDQEQMAAFEGMRAEEQTRWGVVVGGGGRGRGNP
jgi:hypothetical protein